MTTIQNIKSHAGHTDISHMMMLQNNTYKHDNNENTKGKIINKDIKQETS